MLDAKDIELLTSIFRQELNTSLDERFAKQDAKWEKILDARFAKQDAKWEKILDARIYKSECMLLEELDHLETRLTRRMDRMQENLDLINQGLRTLYIEHGNFQLLQERLDSYEVRLTALEKTIA